MYIAIAIAVLAAIAILVFLLNKNKQEKKMTPLVGLAFLFVLAGIFFGENRLMGYGLMGIGVLLAAVDIINKMKVKTNQP